MSPLRRIAPFAVIAFVLAAWWLAAAQSRIFPTPPAVVLGIVELARQGTLALHVEASLWRVALGYGAALALAIPLGSLMGWYGGGVAAPPPHIHLFAPISPLPGVPPPDLLFGR